MAQSSVEAEFRAVAQGMCKVLWLKKILKELKVKVEVPIKLYCDNKATINIAHNPLQQDWTKQMEIDRHFIKKKKRKWDIFHELGTNKGSGWRHFYKGLLRTNFEGLLASWD